MSAKTKRTYNLSTDAVTHVRELAGRVGSATSQDGVVELANERLYRDIRDQEEAALWSRAASDHEFRAEMRAITTAYRDFESWPA